MIRSIASFTGVIFLAGLIGCSTAPTTPEQKASLHDDAMAALNDFRTADPSFQAFLDKAYGYVVFPSVGKGGLGIGGAYGRGEVFAKGQQVGFADLSQGSIGFQAGGQSFAEIVAFYDSDALERFKGNRMELSANASAVALKSGAAETAQYTDGVAVFTHPNAGLMFEATVSGQQFTYQPMKTSGDQAP